MKSSTIEYDKTILSEKRKKDGIFYSPQNIVNYILNQTIGVLLDTKITIENLQNIKILDPACGDGIFLIESYKKLINYYKINFQDFKNPEKFIIENNLYGVDIDNNAVELSIKKLHEVSGYICKNIQQGNSLISDENIAGSLAFDWNKRFGKIMETGGFDIIVGNPPYGALLSENEKKYLSNYDSNVPDYEIFYYFITKGIEIMNKNGYLGYIFPNTFLSRQFGIKYREELLKNNAIISITDLSEDKTFEDANVRTCITVLKKEKSDILTKFSIYSKNEKIINTTKYLNESYLEENSSNWQTLFSVSNEIYSIIQKIKLSELKINDICEVSQGYIPYRRSDLIKKYGEEQGNRIVDERLWHSEIKINENYKQEILGKDVKKYFYTKSNSFIKYTKEVASYVDSKFFELPRILVREIAETTLNCTYLEKPFYNNPSIINIIQKDKTYSLKFLLGILNSKLIGWYHFNTSPKAKKGLFPKILVSDVRNIPIPKTLIQKQNELAAFVDEMIQINIEIENSKSKFIRRITENYLFSEISTKLKDFYLLDFKTFVLEINNKTKKLSLKQQDELEEYFTENKNEILSKVEIQKSIDKQIDTLVYKLYDLTDAEIALVEGI